ncbi:oxygen-independent coproporphyrinogen III oxidase [Sphingobacterium paludis]|uniref:Coproporphyrinogen-III oxidase n=1 Tax=Sphingobacterium paludis TaxID=1476465 RepID=A0A4R7D7D1_9SPHI|nr:oxygen-independent coproporphyrinogen III oxidase [Sphingobacterium paludis]TDS16292.1 oxygen-independent coproporphyrinogen-3 oxidase [Sphingobacterium paludis]
MRTILDKLTDKYNVSAPRYTSYPTVPFWDQHQFQVDEWVARLQATYQSSKTAGISLYVHLPFCESLCTYCGCNTRITKNHAVEIPYIAYLLKEWEMYRQVLGENIRISEIHFGGGTPTFFQATNLKSLVSALLDGAQVADDAVFSFEAHPANTSNEHLQTLYDLGFTRLSLGIQDFDPEVQYVINRHQSIEEVAAVVHAARQIGYRSINFDLIYGLPRQSKVKVEETIRQSLALKPDRISFYSYAHVPWLKPGQRRFTEFDLPAGKQKLALYGVGKAMIEQAGYRDVGMDHFALPSDALFKAAEEGRLHRNFMGYADRYTPLLLGLGVSSISDAWNSFAQNVKTVEEYYQLLDQGRLPVSKGHLLDQEDCRVRQYILDMMCRSNVQLDPGTALSALLLARLKPLEQDGLVEIKGSMVQATTLGGSFLRNICMAFDQRLHRAQSTEKVFSQAI